MSRFPLVLLLFEVLAVCKCNHPGGKVMHNGEEWHPMNQGAEFSRLSFTNGRHNVDQKHRELNVNCTRNDMEVPQPGCWVDQGSFQERPFYGPPFLGQVPGMMMMPQHSPAFCPYVNQFPTRRPAESKEEHREPPKHRVKRPPSQPTEERDNMRVNYVEMAPPMCGMRYMPGNFFPQGAVFQPSTSPMMGIPRNPSFMGPVVMRPEPVQQNQFGPMGVMMGPNPVMMQTEAPPRFNPKGQMSDEGYFPERKHQLFKREDAKRNESLPETQPQLENTSDVVNKTQSPPMVNGPHPEEIPNKPGLPEHVFNPMFTPNDIQFIRPSKFQENNMMFRPPQMFDPQMVQRFQESEQKEEQRNKQLALFHEILHKLTASQDPRYFDRFVNYGPPREHSFQSAATEAPEFEHATTPTPLKHKVTFPKPHPDINPHEFHQESDRMFPPPARLVRGNPEMDSGKFVPPFAIPPMRPTMEYPRNFRKVMEPIHPYEVERKFYGPPKFIEQMEPMSRYEPGKPFEIPKRIPIDEPNRMVEPFYLVRQPRMPYENFGKGEMMFDSYRKPTDFPFMVQMKEVSPHLSRKSRDLSAMSEPLPRTVDSNIVSGLFRKYLPLVHPVAPNTYTTPNPEISTNIPTRNLSKTPYYGPYHHAIVPARTLGHQSYYQNRPEIQRFMGQANHFPYYVYHYPPSRPFYDPRMYTNSLFNNLNLFTQHESTRKLNGTNWKPEEIVWKQSNNTSFESGFRSKVKNEHLDDSKQNKSPLYYVTPCPIYDRYPAFQQRVTVGETVKRQHPKPKTSRVNLMSEPRSTPLYYINRPPSFKHDQIDYLEKLADNVNLVTSNEVPNSFANLEPIVNQERLRRQSMFAPLETMRIPMREIVEPTFGPNVEKSFRIHLQPTIRFKLMCVNPEHDARDNEVQKDKWLNKFVHKLSSLERSNEVKEGEHPLVIHVDRPLSHNFEQPASVFPDKLLMNILNKFGLHDTPCRVVKTIRYIGRHGEGVTKVIETRSNGNVYEKVIREQTPRLQDPLITDFPRRVRHIYEYPRTEILRPQNDRPISEILNKLNLANNPSVNLCVVRMHRLPDGSVEKIIERRSSGDIRRRLNSSPKLPSELPFLSSLFEPSSSVESTNVVRRPRHSLFEPTETSNKLEPPQFFKELLSKFGISGKPSFFRSVRYERGPGDSVTKIVETRSASSFEGSPVNHFSDMLNDPHRPACIVRTIHLVKGPGDSVPKVTETSMTDDGLKPVDPPKVRFFMSPLLPIVHDFPASDANSSSSEKKPEFIFRTVRFERGPGDTLTKIVETRTTKREVIKNPGDTQDGILENLVGKLGLHSSQPSNLISSPTVHLKLFRINPSSENDTKTESLSTSCPTPLTPTTPSDEIESSASEKSPSAEAVIADVADDQDSKSFSFADALSTLTSILCPTYLTRPKSLIMEAYQRFKGSA